MSPVTPEQFRENGRKPFRVTDRGRVYIGDDEFPYPIRKGSIRVEKAIPSHNAVTMTVLVGPVFIEAKTPGAPAIVVAETIPAATKLAESLDLSPFLAASPLSIRNGALRGIANVSAIYIDGAAPLSRDTDEQIALLASLSGAPLYQVDASASRQGFSPDVLIMDEPYVAEAQP
ncbi:hypothetical protein [Mycobacteroides abscessus]|uniref:hypothetical protein n=1 Tax=Mycobacteroides abscessus TaxID=36809 RepID=UPI0007F94966|nr:hypothetical protein [Mycobacteroides abscessus]ANN98192.1 hypothetical protein BAB74_05120 [Mycobacteroides abscessus]